MTIQRLTQQAKPWIIKALKEHGQEDQITWDMSLVTFPDPSVDDSINTSAYLSLIPALVIYVEIATGNDHTPSVYMNSILAPYNLNESRINDAIKETLESLRKASKSIV